MFVNQTGSIYVADQRHHRVLRWSKDARQGEVIAGGHRQGSQKHQLNEPMRIALHNEEKLYVADRDNNKFFYEKRRTNFCF